MSTVKYVELEKKLAVAQSELEQANKDWRAYRERCSTAEAREKETREQFADLKRRLHESEMECSRLRGYMARVREDDTVREDLVTVGEPGGEQRMVPKRKRELFEHHEPEPDFIHQFDNYSNRKPKPKHWIEY